MTQEDKCLLLHDLCGRLPYGVKCENFNHVYGKNIFKVTDIRDNGYICGVINSKHCWSVPDPLELKPYLFPLSSMTEEQYDECTNMGYSVTERWWSMANYHQIDWFNKNHIDYRGLIEKGLALDATNLNIY